jgi:hypothetical protein
MEDVFDAMLAGEVSAASRGIAANAPPQPSVIAQKPLTALVGPEDPRYPAGNPGVVALEFPEAEWLRVLFLPDRDWHALAGGGRRSPVLRMMLPPGPRFAAGMSRLARRFPLTRFLIDPFRHGPEPAAGWQSQVCLAEYDNVWITTLGLVDGSACSWPEKTSIEQALYFVIGEVGAGKLLYASGSIGIDAAAWLRRFEFLDDAQRALILRTNAAEIFS